MQRPNSAILLEVEEYRAQHEITVSGRNVPQPFQLIRQSNFPSYISEALSRMGCKEPTPIQAQGWPIAMCGRNMVSIAQRDSGKTLAYILPAIVHINRRPPIVRGDGPIAIVLAPSDQSAQQIEKVATYFGNVSNVRNVCIYGRMNEMERRQQIRALQAGVELVIATPGKLVHLLSTNETNLNKCTFLVLDETDLMLRKGLKHDLNKIINGRSPDPDAQILVMTSTNTTAVRELVGGHLGDHVQMNIGLTAGHNILQIIDICNEHEKQNKLNVLLGEIGADPAAKMIIFAENKTKVLNITTSILRNGWHALCMHGDQSRKEKDDTLAQFKAASILVTTDFY